MIPELKVLLVSAAVIAFAYTALYPRLPQKSLGMMVRLDLALSGLLLLAVGSVFAGTGTAFSILFTTVPWWAFTFLMAFLIEVPFFMWFCKKYDIDLSPPPE